MFLFFQTSKNHLVCFRKWKNICCCFPNQKKCVFVFPSKIKSLILVFSFLFPQLNISLGLFPQVKYYHLLVETKAESIFTCGNKIKNFILLGEQKIFSLAWENNYRYIACRNKAKDFLLLEKTTNNFFAWENNHRNIFTCENKAKPVKFVTVMSYGITD